MVAAVDIAIEFYGSRMAAFAGHRADRRCCADPVGQRGVENLYKYSSDIIMPYPVIKQTAQELAPAARTDRERRQSARITHGGKTSVGTDSFHNRSELNETATYIPEKIVELFGMT